MRLGIKVGAGLTLLTAGLASTASADAIFSFYAVANNGVNVNTATASQYRVIVSDGGTANGHNVARFRFENSGPAASSICDIYFQDGTLLGNQSIFASSAGVDFDENSPANPSHLPGAPDFNPQTTIDNGGFFASMDSNSPVAPNGINPGEWMTISFELANGRTYLDTIAAMSYPWPGPGQGALRIGIKVQGFADGGSESFIDVPIPLPSEAAMAAAGLLGLGGTRRRRTTV